MHIRTRKLIGTILFLLLIFVYSFLVMIFAPPILMNATWYVEALFYFVAGLAWVPVAGMIITWMSRPDPEDA
ncbi:MAG: DUF2842 domain-containing protein [Pseudomonadota bacterium]